MKHAKSFNEATAISCGDRQLFTDGLAAVIASTRPQRLAVEIELTRLVRGAQLLASTRPQRLAVEIYAHPDKRYGPYRSFNEATAISCGDPPPAPACPARWRCFNEATAISCGDLLIERMLR